MIEDKFILKAGISVMATIFLVTSLCFFLNLKFWISALIGVGLLILIFIVQMIIKSEKETKYIGDGKEW